MLLQTYKYHLQYIKKPAYNTMHYITCLLTIERISIECRKTKTKPITYQLDYSANLKPQ